MPIDTLAIARDLRKHGFTQEQAEGIADAVNQAAGLPDLSALATKNDVVQLRADMATKKDLALLQNEMRADIANAKVDTIKWIIGLVVSSIVINVGTMLALVQLTAHK